MIAPAISFADCELSADFYASFDVFMVFETIPIIIYHIEDTVRMRVVLFAMAHNQILTILIAKS
jgi:hypothetical protein